jgi:muramoyltetrapeptide carboxypeptidase LdcA involved in peptidoglycan recycling
MGDGFITPPPLESGDQVAIVSPASGLVATYPHVYERGLERLEVVFDLDPVAFPTAQKDDEYLYEHPRERARDIEEAFADPAIRGVIATIGGNDQIRILDHLDPDVLRENPTRFYGSSDNTCLVHALWNQGIVSFYGGMVLTDFAVPGPLPEYQEASLRSALFDETIGRINPAPAFTDQDLDWADPDSLTRQPEMEDNPGWDWRGGSEVVRGRTWGGGFETTHQQVTADRHLPAPEALDGCVLLLETSELLPSPGLVRLMLLGLGERGILSRFDGFLVGRTKARTHAVARSKDERETYRRQIRTAFVDVVTEYNETAPIVFNVDFGHTNPILPVPIGGTVTIDPRTERITFE